MKKKIVFVIDELNIGGTEKQLLGVIERLDRNIFEPILVCLRPSAYFERCDVRCEKKLLNVYSLLSLDGLKRLFQFGRYLRKHKIYLVQTFFFDSTVFGVLAARLARVPKIISCRRDMGFWYTKSLLIVLYFLNLLTDRILVNSQAIKHNVVKKEHVSPQKIDVIYNGIDLKKFSVQYDIISIRKKLGIPAEDKVVGIVANLNRPVKRVDLFIEAANLVLKKQQNVSFVIVGDGCLREQLMQQAYELGIKNKVHFVGIQDNVVPYLQLFDVGVLTSESEGFSNSILEYMAAGLPVVCFSSAGNSEIIKDGVNGCVAPNFHSNILSEKIYSLLLDEMLRMDIGAKNVINIKQFSWENIMEKLSKEYTG